MVIKQEVNTKMVKYHLWKINKRYSSAAGYQTNMVKGKFIA